MQVLGKGDFPVSVFFIKSFICRKGFRPHRPLMSKTKPLMSKTKKRLLFICLGNICRSPAAEGVMQHLVEHAERAEEFVIDSAGIGNWHVGELPDYRMRNRGARRGYRFDSRARQFTPDDFDRFDLILVMDRQNLRDVLRQQRTEDDALKVKMLTDFTVRFRGTTAVPDPYYGTDADFDHALDLIEDACAGLLETL